MLDGMHNLAHLSLRNNTLSRVDPNAFVSVPQLTHLDLAHNRIQKFEKVGIIVQLYCSSLRLDHLFVHVEVVLLRFVE